MRHKDVEKCFADGADLDTCQMSVAVLNEQYAGETGYNPGSQMVQIAGIALLNKLDHYVKEKLHVRYYIRYMDDFWILTHKKSDADYIFREIERSLYKYGLQLNKKKSHDNFASFCNSIIKSKKHKSFFQWLDMRLYF